MTQTETVTRAVTTLGTLASATAQGYYSRRGILCTTAFGLKSLTNDQRQQFQNQGHRVEWSHSPKDTQLLVSVLWVMSLTEVGLVTEKL